MNISVEIHPRALLAFLHRVFFLDVAITVIKRRSMFLPRAQADPAEFVFTVRAFANDMIASTVFFNCCVTFWAVLCICVNPVKSLRVVLAFLFPPFEERAFDRTVPRFAAL